MFCGVPNLALAIGYTNASWTLKADLVAQYVCRLLSYMDAEGYAYGTPQPPDPSLPTEPFLDLKAGYVSRSIDRLPKQGRRRRGVCTRTTSATSGCCGAGPWTNAMSFSRVRRPGRARGEPSKLAAAS